MKEYIAHAAVKATTGEIFTGKRHLECRDNIKEYGLKPSNDPYDEGFVTNLNRFVNRIIAAKIAFESGQVATRELALISEMLWNPSSGGRFKYDPIKGYYED